MLIITRQDNTTTPYAAQMSSIAECDDIMRQSDEASRYPISTSTKLRINRYNSKDHTFLYGERVMSEILVL
jgi:hypothetical protein